MIKHIVWYIFVFVAVLLNACTAHVDPVEPDTPGADSTWDIPTTLPYAEENRIAFLSLYTTPDQLIAEGDDDEACAWLWMHETFPKAVFLPFEQIGEHTLDSMRVLFWLRDVETGKIEDVTTIPESAMTAAPFIREWYIAGGNIILWGHAVLYIETLGRLPEGTYTAPKHEWICGCGSGNLDMGHWLMSVQLFPGRKFKKDHSTHPLFKGISIYTNNDIRGFMVKGPGWTEDHNCVFFFQLPLGDHRTQLASRDMLYAA